MPCRSPPNGCWCVVFSGRATWGKGTGRSDLQPAASGRLNDWTSSLFCVFQVILQSGRQPSVLQKLCQLPFQYFSHPHLIRVLFPTLISACYNNTQNKVILQQEMSCVLLATFIQVNIQTQSDILYTVCMHSQMHHNYTSWWLKIFKPQINV